VCACPCVCESDSAAATHSLSQFVLAGDSAECGLVCVSVHVEVALTLPVARFAFIVA
jgi:hypothetical protein